MAGGGTGGHIFPAIAIANAIKKISPDSEILFVGAKGKMEMEKVPEAGYKIEGLDIAGFNRTNLLKNISLPFKLIKSFNQVRKIFSDFRPDAAIGVGGYSSFPVLKYAQSKGIPTFIHEANSFAGKSNKLLAKKAALVFTGYDKMEQFFPSDKLIHSGNPVRENILNARIGKEEARAFFNLESGKPTVLAVGGSLGAASINKALSGGLKKISEAGVQLIWQTGKGNAERAKQASKGFSGIWCGEFITRMDMAYAAADLVISRAGAMTIAELQVAGLPAVFVPYPHAAENHQFVNASRVVEKNGGRMVEDYKAETELVDAVLALLKNHQLLEEMKASVKTMAIRDADMKVAEEVLKHIGFQ